MTDQQPSPQSPAPPPPEAPAPPRPNVITVPPPLSDEELAALQSPPEPENDASQQSSETTSRIKKESPAPAAVAAAASSAPTTESFVDVIETVVVEQEAEKKRLARKERINAFHRSLMTNSSDQKLIASFIAELGPNADQASVTPLQRAAQLGLLRVVQNLIASGANLNAKDNRGRTALHYAVSPYSSTKVGEMDRMLKARKEIVKTLMKAGADASITDSDGQTAMDEARYVVRDSQYVKYMDTSPLAYYIDAARPKSIGPGTPLLGGKPTVQYDEDIDYKEDGCCTRHCCSLM